MMTSARTLLLHELEFERDDFALLLLLLREVATRVDVLPLLLLLLELTARLNALLLLLLLLRVGASSYALSLLLLNSEGAARDHALPPSLESGMRDYSLPPSLKVCGSRERAAAVVAVAGDRNTRSRSITAAAEVEALGMWSGASIVSVDFSPAPRGRFARA